MVVFEPAVVAGQVDLSHLEKRTVPFVVLRPCAAAILPQQLLRPRDADAVHDVPDALLSTTAQPSLKRTILSEPSGNR